MRSNTAKALILGVLACAFVLMLLSFSAGDALQYAPETAAQAQSAEHMDAQAFANETPGSRPPLVTPAARSAAAVMAAQTQSASTSSASTTSSSSSSSSASSAPASSSPSSAGSVTPPESSSAVSLPIDLGGKHHKGHGDQD